MSVVEELQLEKDFNKLEEIVNISKISSEELYDLYNMSLMNDINTIKNKFSWDRLEIVLFIKKLLDGWLVVDKLINFLKKYEMRENLKNFVIENKNMFTSKQDIENIIRFIDWEVKWVKISLMPNKEIFFNHSDDLLDIKAYLYSYKSDYKVFWDKLPKLKVKILD